MQTHMFIPTSNARSSTWSPPPQRCFKLNFDVAIFHDINASGLRTLIRNDLGEVMASLLARGSLVIDSEEAEVLACCKALEFTVDSSFLELIVEGDNITVMKSISCPRPNQSRLGHLYTQCIAFALYFVSINCVRHATNSGAHSLARYARFIDEKIVWLEDSPPPTLEALYFDSC